MHFTNITNVQASFCLAGGADCLGNLLHSPAKNADESAKPIHTCLCAHTPRDFQQGLSNFAVNSSAPLTGFCQTLPDFTSAFCARAADNYPLLGIEARNDGWDHLCHIPIFHAHIYVAYGTIQPFCHCSAAEILAMGNNYLLVPFCTSWWRWKKPWKRVKNIYQTLWSKPATSEPPGAVIPTGAVYRWRKLFDSKVKNLRNSKEKWKHQSPESEPLANCEWQDNFIPMFLPCLLYQGPSTFPIPIQEQGCSLDSHLTPQRSQMVMGEPDSLWNLWLKMLYSNTQAGAYLPRELIKLIVKLKGKSLGSKVQA